MIDKIKSDISNHFNKEVKIISKENRNRNEIFFGNIVEIYSHIFIVSNGIETKSYSYSDILARDVQITFL
ncbi:MAG: Veg family protein [Bacilli bacterium]|nr:Veg family protein [Bacilli bacterium]MDD3895683.1 Veg family protein [Bacilli bacterium]MDD4408175.1 Veg family protein [Bacilli bacterium]